MFHETVLSFNLWQQALQRHYANLQALALDRDTVEETPDYLLPDEEGMEHVRRPLLSFCLFFLHHLHCLLFIPFASFFSNIGCDQFAELIKEFKEAVFPADYDELRVTMPKGGAKRKREKLADTQSEGSEQQQEGDNEQRPKRKKAAVEPVDESHIADLAQTGDVSMPSTLFFMVNLCLQCLFSHSIFLLLPSSALPLFQLAKLTIPQLKEYLKSIGVPAPSKLRKPQLLDLLIDHLASGGKGKKEK